MFSSPGSDDKRERALFLGSDVSDALDLWAELENRRISLPSDRVKSKGFTGASVASVIVHGDPERHEDDRNVMAKAVPFADRDEVRNHREAVLNAPPEFVDRLVKLHFGPVVVADGAKIVFFQDVAGGTTKYRPVSQLCLDDEVEDLVDTVAGVSMAVATLWNRKITVRPIPVEQFLRTEIQHLSSGAGSLDRAAAEFLPHAVSVPWVRTTKDDPIAPNPFMATEEGHPAFEGRSIEVLGGFSHGDLHLDNVMVLRDELGAHPGSFRLIDLRTYEENAPRTRDQCMLLLSTVVLFWRTLATRERKALLTAICDPHREPDAGLDRRLAWLIGQMYGATNRLADQNNFGQAWYRQYLLGIAATAVRFTTFGNIPAEVRWWFVRLAARALRRYCDEAGIVVDDRLAPAAPGYTPSSDKRSTGADAEGQSAMPAVGTGNLDGFVLGRLHQHPPGRTSPDRQDGSVAP
ncbi:hypothetical protein [Amycolatopsis japonica]